MSDQDEAPDTVDGAYAQAETLLADEDARAARRSRLMAAMVREPARRPAQTLQLRRFAAFRQGGWALAASVAALGVLFTLHAQRTSNPPADRRPAPVAAVNRPPAPARSGPSVEPAPTLAPAIPEPTLGRRLAASPSPSGPQTVEADRQATAASEPAPPEAAPEGASPQEALASAPALEADLPVRGEQLRRQSVAAPAPEDPAAGLRAAAAEGRTRAIKALLARGVAVDAPDAEGDTALMKSINEGQVAAAALLFRRGARLEATNRAGVSARDMALMSNNPALQRSLGLRPGEGVRPRQ